MKKLCVRMAILALVASAACVGQSKSANPLSPTIAGPIPGVGITAPTIIAPAIDALVNTNTQPITLQVANAQTTGVRPLSYRFEVATDPSFSNTVFARDGVPNDASGRTAATLPGPLSPERKYYWHARAEDGANSSEFSATAAFSVFTPIVFGAPTLLYPVKDEVAEGAQPRLLIANAPRSGPVTSVYYYIELASSASFSPVSGAYYVPESGNPTELRVPVSLAAGQYFWRARATDLSNSGVFSEAQAFRVSASGGGGGNPGQPCGPPYPNTPLGILQCRRSQFPFDLTPADHVAFLRGSAQDFNAAGIAEGPFGILVKTSGTNCNGYSCDILCSGNGPAQKQWDVLIGIPGHPAVWAQVAPPVTVRQCEIQ
jgi:hypothetical protein